MRGAPFQLKMLRIFYGTMNHLLSTHIKLSAIAILLSCPMAKSEKALPAYDFVQSIGACVHIQHGQDATKIAPLLKYTGISNVRDAADRNYDMSGLIYLNKEAGVKVVIGPGSGARHEDMDATIRMAQELHRAGALLAIEGPNEPNNFGGLTYDGEAGGRELSWILVAKFQRDLYSTVKKDPELKQYPVYGVSETGAQTDNCGLQYLIIPKGAATLMPDGTKYADYANVHNYMYHPSWTGAPHDNQVWNAAAPGADCKADGLYGNYGKTWLNKFDGYTEEQLNKLPRVTTETGAIVGSWDGAITEHVQGCNYLNLFLSQYKRGWSKTFIYEFIDDPDGAFGFYQADYTTPRKSANYMHNFTNLLHDTERIKKLQNLNYSYSTPLPETIHDLLLQKSDGTFLLIIWGEKVEGSETITLQLPRDIKKVTVYDPTIGISPISDISQSNHISLTISDHPIILKLEK